MCVCICICVHFSAIIYPNWSYSFHNCTLCCNKHWYADASVTQWCKILWVTARDSCTRAYDRIIFFSKNLILRYPLCRSKILQNRFLYFFLKKSNGYSSAVVHLQFLFCFISLPVCCFINMLVLLLVMYSDLKYDVVMHQE